MKNLTKKIGIRRLLSILLCLVLCMSAFTYALAEDGLDEETDEVEDVVDVEETEDDEETDDTEETDEVVFAALTVFGVEYTREDVVAMPVTDHTHTRVSSSGDLLETNVRGVLLEEFLADVDDDAIIEFATLDGWDGISAYTMTKAELIEGNALLAYEIPSGDEMIDYVYETDNGTGYFRLWVDGFSGVHAVYIVSLVEEDDSDEDIDVAPLPIEWIGDATPLEFDISIVGLVDNIAYFTLEGFLEFVDGYEQTREYTWLNNFGSSDTDMFTGIYFEDLLANLIGISDFAKGMLVTASDGYERAFFLNDDDGGVFWTDLEGNKMMLAWNGTASSSNTDIIDFDLPRIVIGQTNPEHANRALWMSNVVEIRVTAFGDLVGYADAITAIDAMAVNNITDGIGNDLFGPADNLNRAMFITFLGRALNPGAVPPDVEDRSFTDVDYDSWYGMHVEWAVGMEYIFGYGDDRFGPDDDLLVEHMILIAERAQIERIPLDILDAEGFATRAQAARIIYELMLQLAD